jgi:hypothetical protein
MPAWPMSSGAVVGVLRAIAKKHAETIGELIERMRSELPIGVMPPAGCPMFHETVGAARGRVPTRCKGASMVAADRRAVRDRVVAVMLERPLAIWSGNLGVGDFTKQSPTSAYLALVGSAAFSCLIHQRRP